MGGWLGGGERLHVVRAVLVVVVGGRQRLHTVAVRLRGCGRVRLLARAAVVSGGWRAGRGEGRGGVGCHSCKASTQALTNSRRRGAGVVDFHQLQCNIDFTNIARQRDNDSSSHPPHTHTDRL